MEVLSNRVALEWKQGTQFYTGEDLMLLGRLLCGMNASLIDSIPAISVSILTFCNDLGKKFVGSTFLIAHFPYCNNTEVFGGFRFPWNDSHSTWLLTRRPNSSGKQGC